MMNKVNPFGAMFHHFHQDGSTPLGQGSLTSDRFVQIIEKLQINYQILPAIEWYSRFISNKLTSKQICLTFDDNLKGQFDVAFPIMQHLGLTGFWFIYTSPLKGVLEKLELYRYFRCTSYDSINSFYNDFFNHVRNMIGVNNFSTNMNKFKPKEYLSQFPFYSLDDKKFRYFRDDVLKENNYNIVMDSMIQSKKIDTDSIADEIWFGEEEIVKLSNAGNYIGLHSHSHPNRMSELSYKQQLKEYSENQNILEAIIGRSICVSAHPTNSYNMDTFKVLEKIGINLSFCSNMKLGFKSIFEVPRIDHALIND